MCPNCNRNDGYIVNGHMRTTITAVFSPEREYECADDRGTTMVLSPTVRCAGCGKILRDLIVVDGKIVNRGPLTER